MGVFRMPSLGADMETGRLVEWLVAPGAAVQRGDVVAVVETQKGAIEIEVFEDGILAETLVEPGAEVPVGTPIAEIRPQGAPTGGPTGGPGGDQWGDEEPAAPAESGSPAPAGAGDRMAEAAAAPLPAAATVPPFEPEAPPQPPEPPTAPQPPTPPRPPEPPEAAWAQSPDAAVPPRRRASPAARRRAAERGVALDSLTGTGPQGAIVFADVDRAAGAGSAPTPDTAAATAAAGPSPDTPAAPAAGAAPRRGLDLGEMRKAIAAAMARSKREIPHFYLEHRVALTAARARLEALNADRPPAERLLPAALFIKAAALALARHPTFNGHYVEGAFRPAERVHLGTAVAIRGGGLIAPAIRDADRLDLDQVMARLKDLVARVRSGGLRGSELTDPTATLTSLGDRGVETVWGVIHPPQVAMIGVGRPLRRPWAEGDALAVREVVTLTLAADHRVADGHAGALFLAEIGRILETPEEL